MIITFHIPPGSSGALTAVLVVTVLSALARFLIPPGTYTFEPRGVGSFEPRLLNYIHVAQTIIGLATGSIVLLAGSSVFKSGGQLPWFYASPLVVLGFSVVYAVLFLAFLVFFYEGFLHNENSYTRGRYMLNNVLGFSSLISFAVGYIWLGFVIAR